MILERASLVGITLSLKAIVALNVVGNPSLCQVKGPSDVNSKTVLMIASFFLSIIVDPFTLTHKEKRSGYVKNPPPKAYSGADLFDSAENPARILFDSSSDIGDKEKTVENSLIFNPVKKSFLFGL